MIIKENSDKTITFENTDGITPKQWRVIFNRFIYLGYDFKSIDEIQEYFGKGDPLKPDQSEAVVDILNDHMTKSSISKDVVEICNEKAKEVFGITDRCSAIGYILTDGSKLKLSTNGFSRNRDHREIANIIENPRIIGKYPENTCAMIQFINYGNIRVLGYGFELSNRLTPEQFRALKHYVSKYRMREIQVDIANKDGRVVHTFSIQKYDMPLLNDMINEYFDSIMME